MSEETQPHPHLRVTREEAVLTVTLSSPERRNAQTPSLWLALADIARGLESDVRVVVIRADGPSFSAGLDLRVLSPGGVEGEVSILESAAESAEAMTEVIAPFQQGFAAWADTHAVVVAAVQGHAIGAGFQLALAADLRVVADDVQFCMKEPALGLVPDLAGTKPLVSAVGYARALEICATARYVGATEAAAIGLTTLVVPRGELDATVTDLANAILANPRDAVSGTKALLQQAADRSLDDQRRAERTAQVGLMRALAAQF